MRIEMEDALFNIVKTAMLKIDNLESTLGSASDGEETAKSELKDYKAKYNALVDKFNAVAKENQNLKKKNEKLTDAMCGFSKSEDDKNLFFKFLIEGEIGGKKLNVPMYSREGIDNEILHAINARMVGFNVRL